MHSDVEERYSRRAPEYIETLGSMSAVHPADAHLVTDWAGRLAGPVIDAGCGPGQWTSHLAARGVRIRGVDQVRRFIDHARRTHPGVLFELGDLTELPDPSGGVAGVLAWYSLIHQEPSVLRESLTEFARVLCPGGGLLVGFFTGPRIEQFDHAVASAYRWPVEAMSSELIDAGFVVVEAHTRTGAGYRPHGAILARRAPG